MASSYTTSSEPQPDESHNREMRQQQDGTGDAQGPEAAPGEGEGQIGEGSYEATRDYQKRMDHYLKTHDVEADAAAAKPRSEQEAKDLDQAEREGQSHAKG